MTYNKQYNRSDDETMNHSFNKHMSRQDMSTSMQALDPGPKPSHLMLPLPLKQTDIIHGNNDV